MQLWLAASQTPEALEHALAHSLLPPYSLLIASYALPIHSLLPPYSLLIHSLFIPYYLLIHSLLPPIHSLSLPLSTPHYLPGGAFKRIESCQLLLDGNGLLKVFAPHLS